MVKNLPVMQEMQVPSLGQEDPLEKGTATQSSQCKEIEENNRMGKTRDLFKKIRDTKGTFHAKMGSLKDRNGMDLTEAEDIKKKWRGRDVSREQHRNMYTIKGETDYRPRLDA